MAGSMWEWTADDYAEDYTNASADGSAYVDENSQEKVLRGGGWTSSTEEIRTTSRTNAAPVWGNINSDREYSTIGFRCAYDVSP
jgi:formylglycine-generating enzyme required for sulfatase activity